MVHIQVSGDFGILLQFKMALNIDAGSMSLTCIIVLQAQTEEMSCF